MPRPTPTPTPSRVKNPGVLACTPPACMHRQSLVHMCHACTRLAHLKLVLLPRVDGVAAQVLLQVHVVLERLRRERWGGRLQLLQPGPNPSLPPRGSQQGPLHEPKSPGSQTLGAEPLALPCTRLQPLTE